MQRRTVELLVLNYNGRALLERCLPSVVATSRASRHPARVTVIDNDSTDDSRAWLTAHWPQVGICRQPNRGLASFLPAAAQSAADVVILLNSDILPDPDFVDALLAPWQFDPRPSRLATVPRLWQADGQTYDGQRTAVRWHWGLVQASWRFEGWEQGAHLPGLTASAGAALAVDRQGFLELGGFDPRYAPGIVEDLDLGYRAFQAGLELEYVPAAQAWHLGRGSFGPAFGESGCRHLALRNTLVFQWTHFRHPAHLVTQASGLSLRVLRELGTAPRRPRGRRWPLLRAMWEAWQILRSNPPASRSSAWWTREREFFRRFSPRGLTQQARPSPVVERSSPRSRLDAVADRPDGQPVPALGEASTVDSRPMPRPVTSWEGGALRCS